MISFKPILRCNIYRNRNAGLHRSLTASAFGFNRFPKWEWVRSSYHSWSTWSLLFQSSGSFSVSLLPTMVISNFIVPRSSLILIFEIIQQVCNLRAPWRWRNEGIFFPWNVQIDYYQSWRNLQRGFHLLVLEPGLSLAWAQRRMWTEATPPRSID